MTPTFWIVLAAGLIFVAVVAFVLGRKTASGEARARDLEHELQRTREELASVREGVSDHFEQSARIFGRLAGEYRAFYEHFTETARALGISERRASELLQKADPQQVTAESVQEHDEGSTRVVGENDAGRDGESESPETGDARVHAASAHTAAPASPSDPEGETPEEGPADASARDYATRMEDTGENPGEDTDGATGRSDVRDR